MLTASCIVLKDLMLHQPFSAKIWAAGEITGTRRQFLENICSENDLRSRIFGTFDVKFLACLPLLEFPTRKKWYNCPFLL